MKASSSSQPLVILGSARKESDVRKLLSLLLEKIDIELLDLLDYPISHYSYSGAYPAEDRFQEVVEQLLKHRVVIFATPVYWYSMSGHMKVFFDRLTDLVTIDKKKGRQLKGKKIFLLTVGNSEALPEGFELPFRLTADYLDMEFAGSYYCASDRLDNLSASSAGFLEALKAAATDDN